MDIPALRRIRIFDDISSIAHFIFGLIAALLRLDISATIVFVAYQVYEREKVEFKLGDYIEYALGLLIGGVLRCAFISKGAICS